MTRVLFICLALTVLGGCASVWERSFEPRDGVVLTRSDSAVIMRKVPWTRLEKALTELADLRAQRDVAWEDWSEAERQQADAELIRALQVSDPPESIEILGRSSFKTTDSLRPADGSLRRFAQRIGADYAIWSTRFIGKADRVVQEPVQQSGFRPVRYYDRKRKRYHTRYEYESWTTYIPVVIRADETAWIVYYLRRR